MRRVAAPEAELTWYALMYGLAKVGKTTTALGVPPEMRPVAYVDADEGAAPRLQVLAATDEQRQLLGIKEKVDPYFGPWCADGIEFFYPEPEKGYYGDLREFAENVAPDFKTVILDTNSRLGDELLLEAKENPGSGKRVMGMSGKAKSVHAAPADYGMSGDRLVQILKILHRQPCHVLMLSHERTAEVRDTEAVKRVIAGPSSIGSKLIEQIPTVVDMVLRLETRMVRDAGQLQQKVVLRTKNHKIFLAGDRSGIFEDGQELKVGEFWESILKYLNLMEKRNEE